MAGGLLWYAAVATLRLMSVLPITNLRTEITYVTKLHARHRTVQMEPLALLEQLRQQYLEEAMKITLVKITLVAVFVLTVSPMTALFAQAAPPTIPGNPGVPGLLAEIEALEFELAATKSELVATESELAVTSLELVATQSDLDITNALLEREQNRYRVPQTGQGECWSAFNENPFMTHYPVACGDFPGQDGAHKAGLAPPFNRFVDNGDGTITDRFTELVWLKQADCVDGYSWQNAVNFANHLRGGLNICGLQDQSGPFTWRLPNVRELMSLLDFGSTGFSGDTSLPDDHPFTGIGRWYWTSTTFAVTPDTDVSAIIYGCYSRDYGQDNRFRFNDAYIANLWTGELIHTPKEDRDTISWKHDHTSGCIAYDFEFDAPDLRGLGAIGTLVVRDAIE